MEFLSLSKTPIGILKNSLDAYALRHKAIGENIANVESTGYRSLKVSFEESLSKVLHNKQVVMRTSDPRHEGMKPGLAEVKEAETGAAGKVNIESEMAELAKNQIRFDFSARVLARMYQGIRASISGQVR